jgi:hypothetical protein
MCGQVMAKNVCRQAKVIQDLQLIWAMDAKEFAA